MTYLQFMDVIQYVWSQSHPDIPFYAKGLDKYAQYPCVVYSLELRRPVQNERKPRAREQINSSDPNNAYDIIGQRFLNLVKFCAYSESDPRQAEEIIEVFQDFMLEFQEMWKWLGVSECVFDHRGRDGGESRSGVDIVERSLFYQVTIEKVVKRDIGRLREIFIDIRQRLGSATPSYNRDESVQILLTDEDETTDEDS